VKTIWFLLCLIIFPGAFLRGEDQPPPEAFIVQQRIPGPGKRITPYLRYQVESAWRQDELRQKVLSSIRTSSDLLQLQRQLRRKLLEAIGGLPEQKTPLNPRITGSIRMEGYRVEKLIFESLPGFHVTALLYIPDDASPTRPKPAVLVPCGHSPIAKAHTRYQKISARLAKRGYIVLCWDPVGQGERSQFWDAERSRSRYNRVCGEHAVLGNLAYLVGANLARWEIWDGMRALDYLLSRPDVDSSRISITGTSGGGFQASHIAALDERIKVAAPSCYISALPMRMNNRIFEDPDSDPEQDLYRMVADGIDHPGLLLLIYPRPVIVCAAVEDFFPIEGTRKTFREVAAVYRMFNIPERIALTEGYHRHNYSDANQEVAFAFLDRFNNLPPKYSLDSVEVLAEKALWCTKTGQVLLDYKGGKSLMELIREYFLARKDTSSSSLSSVYYGDYYPGIKNWPVVPYQGKPPQAEVAWQAVGGTRFKGSKIDRYLLYHSRELSIPLLHFQPLTLKPEKTLLWFSARGKAVSSDWPEIKKYLEEGYQVLSFDFRGQGENRMLYNVISVDDPSLAEVEFNTQYYSPISGVLANYVYNSLLVGRPYFLQMIEDAEIVVRFAAEKLGVKKLWVTAGGEAYTLAASIAEVLPEVSLLPVPEAKVLKWSEIVEQMQQAWPIEFLLPGGAYIH